MIDLIYGSDVNVNTMQMLIELGFRFEFGSDGQLHLIEED